MESYRLTTSLDVGEDKPVRLVVRGKTLEQAYQSMANYLHLQMFESDVANNLYKDYVDYENEETFLAACREDTANPDSNGASYLIWKALHAAANSIEVEKLT